MGLIIFQLYSTLQAEMRQERNWSKSMKQSWAVCHHDSGVCIFLCLCMPYDCPAFNFTGSVRKKKKEHNEASTSFLEKLWVRLWCSNVRLYGLNGISISSTTNMIFYIIPIILPLGLIFYQLSSEQWSLLTLWYLKQYIICVISWDSDVLV